MAGSHRLPAKRQRVRKGSALPLLIGGIAMVAIIGCVVWFLVRGAGEDRTKLPLLAEVTRGPYEHVVVEEGEVESSNNVEIRCEVKSRAGSTGPSTSILDVIPEGTQVGPGDWLATLDSSGLEQELRTQKLAVNNSEILVTQAKAAYDTAVIAREEYLKGTYEQERKTILNAIFVAEENLKKAQLSYDSVKRSVAKGTLGLLQLESEKFRVDAAANDLALAKQQLAVLDEYTKKKMLTQLDSDIEAARVQLQNEQDSHLEEQTKYQEIADQIERCKLVAPAAGQVVYANVQSSRSGSEFVVEQGASVRERQVLIRLPDPNEMQVSAKINESRISLVQEGMPVSVRIDAFGDEILEGEVIKVNKYAEPVNFWSSNIKEYGTLVKILEPTARLRPGLTAEIRIHVENRPDALQIPVQAVYDRNGYTFCLVQNGENWETRRIVVDSTNEKVVALDEEKSEVKENEKVVMNPRQHVAKFDFSRFPEVELAASNTPKAKGGRAAGTAGTADGKGGKRAPGPGNVAGKGPREPGGKGGQEKGKGGPDMARGGGPGGQRGGSPAEMFQRLDSDADGKISMDELQAMGGFGERLREADTNSDGSIDQAELTSAIGRMRAARGGAEGRPGGGE